MRIQLIDSSQEEHRRNTVNRERTQLIPQPGPADNNEGRIRIYSEDNTQQELASVREELLMLKQKLEQKQQALMDAEEENEWLKNELDRREQELLDAMNRTGTGEEITTEDLEDKHSMIGELQARNRELQAGNEELQARNEELEEQLRDNNRQSMQEQAAEIQHLREELENERREKETAQKNLAGYMGMESEMTEELRQHLENTENLKRQLEEAQQEEGRAFEQLREMNLRFQKDMKYVEFYEKVPEKKIDGLELFRSQIRKLDEKLSRLLDDGLRKAYIFRGNSLLEELEANKNQFTDIMENLRNLVENYEYDGDPAADDVKTTEEYRREAEEALEELEKTLRSMQTVTGKFLKIKNIIGFAQYNDY